MYVRNEKYISVTDEPEHFIPFQESPQGSPPLDFQPLSFEREFMLLYITLREETARHSKTSEYLSTYLFHGGKWKYDVDGTVVQKNK